MPSKTPEERARLIMQSTVVTAADIIEQIHQAETAAKVELAEHLDKTIAVAADAVNRMNAAEAKITCLREVLKDCATSIEKLAFEIPPPNKFTPQFMLLVVGLRQALQARR